MKKQLMTTTALVAAGVIAVSGAALGASKPKLKIGGYFEAIVGMSEQDEAGHITTDTHQDSEVHFKGSVKLDNGLKITTRVELEGQAPGTGTTIDEAYMNISGGFGSIRLGSEDAVPNLMVTRNSGSWATNVGQNTNFDVGDWVETPSGHRASTVQRLDIGNGDSEKISYFTPRRGGFQVGLSYIPSFNQGNNGDTELESAGHHTGVAVAVSYGGKFGGAKIGAAAGYMQAESSTSSNSDLSGLAMGIKATVGKITVAFGTGREKDINPASATSATQGNSYVDFGFKYDLGKDKFSIGYLASEDDASTAAGKDETQVAMASYRREMGPGVQYRLNLMYGDYEGEAAGTGDDNSGYAITTSIRLAF